ncbi:hypothetical protein [Microbacterium xanthum]|nr:hypothetical protein [Microbacterium sp. KSW-48]MDZ8171183.1 hypothetical protein [Microbacterium sp. KSW-48]
MGLNVKSAWLAAGEVLPTMTATGRGAIVNTESFQCDARFLAPRSLC